MQDNPQETTPSQDPVSQDPLGEGRAGQNTYRAGGSDPWGDAGGRSELEQARSWVRHNQMPAMLGAFALGTFIGLMMRR